MNYKNKTRIIIIMITLGLLFVSQLSAITKAEENQIPTVTITSPNEGDIVAGIITIAGTASDPDGEIQSVTIRTSSGPSGIANGTNIWSFIMDTTILNNGIVPIHAISYDGQNYSNTYSINITVDNSIDPDNQIPTLNILTPNDEEIVSGETIITGTAEDNDGTIKRVEIKINTESWEIATGTTNWNYNWDTTTINNGKHTIYARSYDGYNYSKIKSINITVDNENISQIPSITITNPSDNDIIKGETTITGTSEDNDGTIQRVEIRINTGTWETATGTTNWNYNWDTTTIDDGTHTIYARSYNGEKYSNTVSVEIIIDNIIGDVNQIPTIKFTHPLTGDNLSGIRNIYGSSSDSDGIIQYVQIRMDDGVWMNASGANLWSYSWDTSNVTDGEHIVYARSFDGQDYSTVESIIIEVKNISTPGFELAFLIISIMISIIFIKNYKKIILK